MTTRHSASTYLDTELFQWLKAEAQRRHCTQAQVIRTALVEMKERREADLREHRTNWGFDQ
jgi:hypothetical protein